MTDPHRRFFSIWSRFYDGTPLLGPLLRAQQDHALERLSPKPSERVLDLGCGSGRAFGTLGKSGFGADASMDMLRKAPHGRVVCAGASALPFRTGAFDALLATNSFHHAPEPLGTLREMRRVLGDGGRAVLVDPNLEHPLARLTIYGGEAMLFGMGVHLHSAHEWIALCTQAGFAHVIVEPLTLFGLGAVSLCVEARA